MKSLNRFSHASSKNVIRHKPSELDPIESNSESSPNSPVKRRGSRPTTTSTNIAKPMMCRADQPNDEEDDFERGALNSDLIPRDTPSFQLNPVIAVEED